MAILKRVRLGKRDRDVVDFFITHVGYVDPERIERVVEQLRGNPDTWWRIAQSTDRRILRLLVQIPNLPWEVREYLLLHSDRAVRDSALVYGSFSSEELDNFLSGSSGWSWYALAARKNLPEKWVEKLIQHPETRVRMAFASNRYLPKPIVHRITLDNERMVRARAAARSDLEADDLLRLSSDPEAEVRIEAVQNPQWLGDISEEDLQRRTNREVCLLAEKGDLSDEEMRQIRKLMDSRRRENRGGK